MSALFCTSLPREVNRYKIDTKKAPEGAFSFKLLTITRQKRSQRLEVQLGYLLLVQQMDLLALQHV